MGRRSLLLIVLLFGLLLVTAPVRAEHDNTCHPPPPPSAPSPRAFFTYSYFPSTSPIDLQLTGTIDTDGSVDVSGQVRVRRGKRDDVYTADRGGPAQASCSDVDDDGVAGIVALSFTATKRGPNPSSTPVDLRVIGNDIEQRGEYDVAVAIDGVTETVTVDAQYGQRGRR